VIHACRPWPDPGGEYPTVVVFLGPVGTEQPKYFTGAQVQVEQADHYPADG
jgi:hypothetical protein